MEESCTCPVRVRKSTQKKLSVLSKIHRMCIADIIDLGVCILIETNLYVSPEELELERSLLSGEKNVKFDRRESDKRYVLSHKDKIKKYLEQNRERIRERRKEYQRRSDVVLHKRKYGMDRREGERFFKASILSDNISKEGVA